MKLLYKDIKVRRFFEMYWHDIYTFQNSIEHEFKFRGKYGAKGEKRAKRKRASPMEIKKQNQTNRIIRMRRLVKANFLPGDWWCCIKYPAGIGSRMPVEDVQKDVSSFLAAVRASYKKAGVPFKWVSRMEIGERGGIHIHLLVNRLWNQKMQTDVILAKAWEKVLKKRGIKRTQGLIDFRPIYESGGYEALAAYITKQPEEEEYEQLSLFSEKEKRMLLKTSSSRNLIRPEPVRKKYEKRTLRRLIEDGPRPSPGYYIDQDSVISGINPFSGLSYYKYTECRLNEMHARGEPRGGYE